MSRSRPGPLGGARQQRADPGARAGHQDARPPASRGPRAGRARAAWRRGRAPASWGRRTSRAAAPRRGPGARARRGARRRPERSTVVSSRCAIASTGANRTAAICGSVGSPSPRARTTRSASRSAPASTWVSASPIAATVTARSSSSWACSSGREASGLTRTPAAGDERDRPHADGVAQRAVLALDVEHERPAAEQQHPPQQRLDQRALALAELAEHDRVGVVQARRRRRGPTGHNRTPRRRSRVRCRRRGRRARRR